VIPISDDPRRFEPGSRLHHDDGRVLIVESVRRHRDRLLVKFEGSNSRGEAEALRGPLYVGPEDLRRLGDDEFWEHDVIGCDVVTVSGERVGRAAEVVSGVAQDLLRVEVEGADVLIPMVKEIILSVDLAGRRIVVDPPEGLLEG